MKLILGSFHVVASTREDIIIDVSTRPITNVGPILTLTKKMKDNLIAMLLSEEDKNGR